MKLFELSGVKQFKEEYLSNIVNQLIKDKKIKVERGSFAFAIIPADKNYIYKVWTEDKGFDEYVKFEATHKSPYYAKFLGKVHELPIFFKHPEEINSKMKVVRIEKLEDLSEGTPLQKAVFEIIDVLFNINIAKLTKEDVPTLLEKAAKAYRDNKEFAKLDGFMWAMIELLQYLEDKSIHADLKGNIMVRGSVPVITDPFFSKGSFKKMTASDMLYAAHEGAKWRGKDMKYSLGKSK